jgi:hypothetical protein
MDLRVAALFYNFGEADCFHVHTSLVIRFPVVFRNDDASAMKVAAI